MEVDDSVDQCGKDSIHDHCKLYVCNLRLIKFCFAKGTNRLTYFSTVLNLTQHQEMKLGIRAREHQIIFCREGISVSLDSSSTAPSFQAFARLLS